MEPFAYEKPKTKALGRLVVAGLAAASLSIWYFDLIPTLDQVPTGTVDSAENSPSPDDFLALLAAEKQAEYNPANITAANTTAANTTVANGLPMDEILNAGQPSDPSDSVFDSFLSDTDPIEDSFPEFGGLSEPTLEPPPVKSLSAVPSDDSTILTADLSSSFNSNHGMIQADFTESAESGIQQAAFHGLANTPSAARRKHLEPENAFNRLMTKNAPAVLSSDTAQKLHSIDQLIQEKATLKAHAMLSELYWNSPEIRPMIQARIDETAAEIYINPKRHFAEPYIVDFGETLDQIAEKHNVPWTYLGRLNSVTPETLQAGRTLKVLKGPFGAVVDVSKFELTIHAHGWYVRRYRIGTGHAGSTPIGNFTVKNKIKNPQWYNPDGGIVDADDPSNPLGEYWLGLGDHIGIHGTIDPASIGQAQSRGCIHMTDADISEVFNLLSTGSPVKIRR